MCRRSMSAPNRPRAKSNASARTIGRNKRPERKSSNVPSDEEDNDTPNRSRSHSNASSIKGGNRRSMLPSFGSFGKKSGLSNLAGGFGGSGTSKRKGLGRERDRQGYEEDSRRALYSDEDWGGDEPTSPSAYTDHSRSRLSMPSSRASPANDTQDTTSAPPFRRTRTAPLQSQGHYVKALYDFAGSAHDELRFTTGDIIQVMDEVDADWWMGELDGHHGIFPSAYCEDYNPTPVTAKSPPPRNLPPTIGKVTGRAMPPPAPVLVPESPIDLLSHNTSESELSNGYDDADEYATATLGMYAQQPSASASASQRPPAPAPRQSITAKKAPPPPPPASRRIPKLKRYPHCYI